MKSRRASVPLSSWPEREATPGRQRLMAAAACEQVAELSCSKHEPPCFELCGTVLFNLTQTF